MNMKKRAISALLVVIMIMSVSVPALATGFTDLKGHWSEKCMTDLVGKGLLTGYSDGTMRPDSGISNVEALTVLSRLYYLTDSEKEYIAEDYDATVKNIVSSDYSWAYDSLEICLAAGIVTKDELKSLSLSDKIVKERLAVYLVRALKLTGEADALSSVELPFKDSESVSSACHGFVAVLVSLKIISGDDQNNFAPKSGVTRAVVATMVSRSLDHLDSKSLTLTLDNYSGVTRLEGILSSVSGSTVNVCGYDGLVREYTLTSSAKTRVNGDLKTISSDYLAYPITLSIKNKAVIAANIEYNSSIKYVQGPLNILSSGYIYVGDSSISSALSSSVPSSALITRNGSKVSSVSALYAGLDFLTIKLKNNVITEIYAKPGCLNLVGIVDELSYGPTNTLKIIDSDGVNYYFKFDIDSLPTITRAGKTITIDRVKKGSSVTIDLERSAIKTIKIEGSEATVTGRLNSYTASADGVNWVITVNNEKRSYSVDDNVSVYYGKTQISLSDVKIDDQVSVLVYDDEITEITLLTSESSPTKATGTVLKIDTKAKRITILNSSDKLEYIDITNLVSVVDSSTGRTSTGTGYINVNSRIIAYGSYTGATTFAAKSIIIE